MRKWVAHGWLREYMVQKRYKWLNYYVRISKTSFGPTINVSHSVFRVGGTQWVLVLSAAATQNRVKNARGGPKRRLQQALTAVGGTPAA